MSGTANGDAAMAAASDAVAAATVRDGGTAVEVAAEPGDVIVALPPAAAAAAQRIASIRHISVGQAMSDALALQETVAVEKASGARLLIERNGNVKELAG